MIQLETLLDCYRNVDSFAAIELLVREPDVLAAMKLLSQAANDSYWKAKDLPAAVVMGRAGVQHCLTAAARAEPGDAALASDLRGHAKAMAYNVASFTWPGWDEPGITIGPGEQIFGLDAAKTNLRLAVSLNKGPLPMSRACWILAAHELAACRYGAAESNFRKAADQAAAAGAEADRWLSVGFEAMTKLLAVAKEPEDARVGALQKCLADAECHLQALEHGEMFIQQILTARRVFSA